MTMLGNWLWRYFCGICHGSPHSFFKGSFVISWVAKVTFFYEFTASLEIPLTSSSNFRMSSTFYRDIYFLQKSPVSLCAQICYFGRFGAFTNRHNSWLQLKCKFIFFSSNRNIAIYTLALVNYWRSKRYQSNVLLTPCNHPFS